MSPRTTSILTIAGTLLIGMILGGLLTGAVIGKRAQHVFAALASEAKFVRNLETLLEPTTNLQRDSLRPVLQRYGKTIAHATNVYYKMQFSTLDSMSREVAPMLTPEQQQRLAERLRRVEQRQKHLFEQENRQQQREQQQTSQQGLR
jgi:hypothetical protein